MRNPSIGSEVTLVAYNARSARKAKREAFITGIVSKVTKDYIHIKAYQDGAVWKAPRNQ